MTIPDYAPAQLGTYTELLAFVEAAYEKVQITLLAESAHTPCQESLQALFAQSHFAERFKFQIVYAVMEIIAKDKKGKGPCIYQMNLRKIFFEVLSGTQTDA
jgi:hypothetical protein